MFIKIILAPFIVLILGSLINGHLLNETESNGLIFIGKIDSIGKAQIQSSLYMSTFPVNREDAFNYCSLNGYNLIHLPSHILNKQMTNIIKEYNVPTAEFYWTSGIEYESQPGKYYWDEYGNQRPFIYSNWAAYEPMNMISRQCVTLLNWSENLDGYQWAAVPCTHSRRFICVSA